MPTGVPTAAGSFAVFSGLFITSNLFEYLAVEMTAFLYDLESLRGLNYSNWIDIMHVSQTPSVILLHVGRHINSG